MAASKQYCTLVMFRVSHHRGWYESIEAHQVRTYEDSGSFRAFLARQLSLEIGQQDQTSDASDEGYSQETFLRWVRYQSL